MKLAVLTCAVFPTEEEARRKMWIFFESCAKWHITPCLYGIGERFGGYRHMKLDLQLKWLQEHRDEYTHVLYTDGWDAMFCTPLDTVINRYYDFYGAPPILVAAYDGLANVSNPDEDYPESFVAETAWKYPHVGGYFAQMDAIILAFEKMRRLPRQTGDDCFNWYDAWAEGWFRPVLDSQCLIFQVSDRFCDPIRHGGYMFVYNHVTKTLPSILHLSGGYTDPETGKDDRMIPWATALEII